MLFIDLNCDMGENQGDDSAIIKYISSANIACGGHAGDVQTMNKTIELALKNNVNIGAHPSYKDKENFGRIETGDSKEKIIEDVLSQLRLFKKTVDSFGVKISHIKFHGALYNRLATDYNLTFAVVKEIFKEFGRIPVFTLANSISEKAINDAGMIAVSEGFVDRAYTKNATLVSRSQKGAVLEDIEMIKNRALKMLKGEFLSIDGFPIKLNIRTFCVHGDTPNSVLIAKEVYKSFLENRFKIGGSFEI